MYAVFYIWSHHTTLYIYWSKPENIQRHAAALFIRWHLLIKPIRKVMFFQLVHFRSAWGSRKLSWSSVRDISHAASRFASIVWELSSREIVKCRRDYFGRECTEVKWMKCGFRGATAGRWADVQQHSRGATAGSLLVKLDGWISMRSGECLIRKMLTSVILRAPRGKMVDLTETVISYNNDNSINTK